MCCLDGHTALFSCEYGFDLIAFTGKAGATMLRLPRSSDYRTRRRFPRLTHSIERLQLCLLAYH